MKTKRSTCPVALERSLLVITVVIPIIDCLFITLFCVFHLVCIYLWLLLLVLLSLLVMTVATGIAIISTAGAPCAVFSERVCVCNRVGRRNVPAVWHTRWPADWHVFSRQHCLWHHVRGVLQQRPTALWRLRWLQLQRLGYSETRPGRLVSCVAVNVKLAE